MRVSVYIDGANFLYGLKSIRNNYSDYYFDFEKYIKKIVGKRNLVKMYYYNASLKQEKNPEIFKRQQKLFARLRGIGRCQVILCKRQRRTHKDGHEFFTIKGDDIHLAIDMLRDAYENKFDSAILITGDGDFSPLVKAVKAKGKLVENHHFKDNISLDLIKHCNNCTVIDKKTVNKFFFRDSYKLEDTESGKKMKKIIKKSKTGDE
ncbi:NYN domain-containing protein [Candidatus Woesearchaeota archaeon]|nr:NYN domain-containing protein [Candidatus Woesearchaeota archaeon]